MEITKDIAELICELEYEIGRECYNPNTYDGYTGAEGCGYRYPITVYRDNNGRCVPVALKSRLTFILDEITSSTVATMKYRFGSNHLFVGKGLRNVLSFLEDRYGIDFDALESARKNK